MVHGYHFTLQTPDSIRLLNTKYMIHGHLLHISNNAILRLKYFQ